MILLTKGTMLSIEMEWIKLGALKLNGYYFVRHCNAEFRHDDKQPTKTTHLLGQPTDAINNSFGIFVLSELPSNTVPKRMINI